MGSDIQVGADAAGAGAGLPSTLTWTPITTWYNGCANLGSPFANCAAAVLGPLLILRGVIDTSAVSTWTNLFDIPVGLPKPAAIYRAVCQTGTTMTLSAINFNSSGPVSWSAGATGSFLVLDGIHVPIG